MSSFWDYFLGPDAPVKIHTWRICHDVTTDPHQLTCYLLSYVLQSRALHTLGSTTNVIRKGDMLLIPPGIAHRWIMPDDLYLYHCLFEADEVPEVEVEKLPLQVVSVPIPLQNKVEDLLFKMAAIDKPKLPREAPQQKVTYLTQLLDIYRENCAPETVQTQGHNYILRALKLLNENRELHISELAKEIGLHPDYLNRLFKKELKISPMEYKIRLRIKDAVEQLEQTELTVRQIARNCGYKNTSQMCAQFKEIMHVTPGEYRLRVRSGEQIGSPWGKDNPVTGKTL